MRARSVAIRLAALAALVGGLALAPVASAGELEVPLEIGVGPATHTWAGPVGTDQLIHGGVVLTTDFVLDRAWLRENKERVPERWRSLAGVVDEVRIRPLPFLPESLIVSPRMNDTGMVGASWRPISVGVPLITSPVRVGVDAGLRLTGLVMWTRTLPTPTDPKTTFFLRPGLDLGADAVLPIDDVLSLRLGTDAHAYVPQGIGTFGVGQRGERMWFVWRTFLEFRVRIPVTVDR